MSCYSYVTSSSPAFSVPSISHRMKVTLPLPPDRQPVRVSTVRGLPGPKSKKLQPTMSGYDRCLEAETFPNRLLLEQASCRQGHRALFSTFFLYRNTRVGRDRERRGLKLLYSLPISA